MNAKTLSAVVLSLTLALPALAKTVSGVDFPETLKVEGKELKLNGAGLRTATFLAVKVYAAGLYVETTSQDAAQVISSDQTKRVRMSMLRDLEKQKIVDAITDGFEKNAKAQLPALKERLAKLTAAIPAQLKKGDELVLTYVPGKGTRIETKGGEELVVEGKDFADALFSVWLGKHPVDGDLKAGMLGKAED
jgi:hypothetical protein